MREIIHVDLGTIKGQMLMAAIKAAYEENKTTDEIYDIVVALNQEN